jgi:hypothetical protein
MERQKQMATGMQVIEGWTGPGRRDAAIQRLVPADDGLHMQLPQRGVFEWWYFDAHLESGHTLVVFFHASNPNPGLEGRVGVEVVLLRPDGKRVTKFFPYQRQDFSAARDQAEVTIGRNTIRVAQRAGGLPVYEVCVDEPGLGCHLTYTAEVNGWKPGTGISRFGELGFFGWTIPFARAAVSGTITDGDTRSAVKGIGYHDHNWLNFPFPRMLKSWMWGRIYSKNFTVDYAIIQCNARASDHLVKVLMLAEGQEVILSSGEFEYAREEFEYNPKAGYAFPKKLVINAPGELKATLRVNKMLEAQDMLENYQPVLRFIAGKIMRLKPGYFRLVSDAELEVRRGGTTVKERGTALHDIVLFKPLE